MPGLRSTRPRSGDSFQKPEQEEHEGYEGLEGVRAHSRARASSRRPTELETAPGFEIAAMISESRSLGHRLQLSFSISCTRARGPSAPFISFVPFMLFLFRVLESQLTSGPLMDRTRKAGSRSPPASRMPVCVVRSQYLNVPSEYPGTATVPLHGTGVAPRVPTTRPPRPAGGFVTGPVPPAAVGGSPPSTHAVAP